MENICNWAIVLLVLGAPAPNTDGLLVQELVRMEHAPHNPPPPPWPSAPCRMREQWSMALW